MTNPLYRSGFPNPDRLGFIPLRHSSEQALNTEAIAIAAGIIGTPANYVDAEGYEQEIIAAAIEGGAGKIAYVQCRAREAANGFVDINFYIHLREPDGKDSAWPIESYNPYFGCDVGFIGWIDQVLILIYREKHHTYVCRIGPGEAPVFRQIADDWVINDRILGYWGWRETSVSRLSLPTLQPLEPISEEEASAQSALPSKPWRALQSSMRETIARSLRAIHARLRRR